MDILFLVGRELIMIHITGMSPDTLIMYNNQR